MKFSLALSAVMATALTLCNGFVLQTPSPLKAESRMQTTSALHMVTSLKQPGTAKLDTPWSELGFEFRPTNSHIRMVFKDGEWGKPELVKVCRTKE